MSILTTSGVTPLTQRIAAVPVSSLTRDAVHELAGIDHAHDLLRAMITLDSYLEDFAEEVAADLTRAPRTALGSLIAELAAVADFIIHNFRGSWSEMDLDGAMDAATRTGLIQLSQRASMQAWVADLLWEACTGTGLANYSFDDATADDARVALATAWVCLNNAPLPDQALVRYQEHCESPATNIHQPSPGPDISTCPVTPAATTTGHRSMTSPLPVLPLLQPGNPTTQILTDFHLDPRHEDTQMYAAFDYAHLALGRLLITAPEYIRDTVEACYSDLFGMPAYALECVTGELNAIAAHVLHRMQDERTLVPLSTGLEEVMNWGLLDHTEEQPLVTWLAELQWRGTGGCAILEEPASRDVLLTRARTALVGAATVLYSLPDPLDGISDYDDHLAEI